MSYGSLPTDNLSFSGLKFLGSIVHNFDVNRVGRLVDWWVGWYLTTLSAQICHIWTYETYCLGPAISTQYRQTKWEKTNTHCSTWSLWR